MHVHFDDAGFRGPLLRFKQNCIMIGTADVTSHLDLHIITEKGVKPDSKPIEMPVFFI